MSDSVIAIGQTGIGLVLSSVGVLALLRPAIADRFYDLGNRGSVQSLARWGWKTPLRNYEMNRAKSRRLIPLGAVVIGVAFVAMGAAGLV